MLALGYTRLVSAPSLYIVSTAAHVDKTRDPRINIINYANERGVNLYFFQLNPSTNRLEGRLLTNPARAGNPPAQTVQTSPLPALQVPFQTVCPSSEHWRNVNSNE